MGKILSWIGMMAILLAMPLQVLACGISLISSGETWTYGNDGSEQSFINYEKGYENLVISRNFDNDAISAVWVVPIPAPAQTVNVDVISETPNFSGYEVTEKASLNVDRVKDVLMATQIYPLIPRLIYSRMVKTAILSVDAPAGLGYAPMGALGSFGDHVPEVTLYQHLEKDGMTSEVLSAVTSEALYDYLKTKGLSVQKDAISVLQPYIGRDFSFVATWVSSAGEHSVKGILMRFPTQKIFYPLYPESVYPGSGFPETVTVVGHVTPQLYPQIKNATQVSYYHSNSGSTLDNFFSTNSAFNFTKIVIQAQPASLTQDLYISSLPPLRILHADAIALQPILYGMALLWFVSTVAAVLANLFLGLGQSWRQLLTLGLGGMFTLIGTVIISRLALPAKRVRFVLFHSLAFVVILKLLSVLITLQLRF